MEYSISEAATMEGAEDPLEIVALFRITMTEPSFVAHHSTHLAAEAIDERFDSLCRTRGYDGRGLFGRLAIECALTTARVALEYWADLPEPRPEIADTLRTAFRQTAAGMADPVPGAAASDIPDRRHS
ncbi:hypothetical protein ACIGKQ_16605 [Gordonia sp. NPDC062954]|uniref:hypothetical protein n=1 Tax=unclassified Gordonia (in: high G+C Gram-positive bacteria) TaxID=2657482 RepID=UPI00257DBFD7|nr:hypothetical protein [Gordonia sp. (in: high G+C Gram-positive bacteria)]